MNDNEIEWRVDSTWIHGGARRWPVRHHSGISMERTKRPKWWKPVHPNRTCYFRSCLPVNKWDRLSGWSSSANHQYVTGEANRRYRHQANHLVRAGQYDLIPYTNVDWVW